MFHISYIHNKMIDQGVFRNRLSWILRIWSFVSLTVRRITLCIKWSAIEPDCSFLPDLHHTYIALNGKYSPLVAHVLSKGRWSIPWKNISNSALAWSPAKVPPKILNAQQGFWVNTMNPKHHQDRWTSSPERCLAYSPKPKLLEPFISAHEKARLPTTLSRRMSSIILEANGESKDCKDLKSSCSSILPHYAWCLVANNDSDSWSRREYYTN